MTGRGALVLSAARRAELLASLRRLVAAHRALRRAARARGEPEIAAFHRGQVVAYNRVRRRLEELEP